MARQSNIFSTYLSCTSFDWQPFFSCKCNSVLTLFFNRWEHKNIFQSDFIQRATKWMSETNYHQNVSILVYKIHKWKFNYRDVLKNKLCTITCNDTIKTCTKFRVGYLHWGVIYRPETLKTEQFTCYSINSIQPIFKISIWSFDVWFELKKFTRFC